jgi:hypothetical protein
MLKIECSLIVPVSSASSNNYGESKGSATDKSQDVKK